MQYMHDMTLLYCVLYCCLLVQFVLGLLIGRHGVGEQGTYEFCSVDQDG